MSVQTIKRDFLFPPLTRAAVIGGSMTGKSYLLERYFTGYYRKNKQFYLILAFRIEQDSYARLKKIFGDGRMEMHRGIDFLKEFGQRDPSFFKEHQVVVILDDLQKEAFESEEVGTLFTVWTHHFRLLAAFIISQNPYLDGRYKGTIMSNTNYTVIMRSGRAENMIKRICRDIAPSNSEFIFQCYQMAVADLKDEYPYVVINSDSRTMDTLVYSKICKGERPIVYLPE